MKEFEPKKNLNLICLGIALVSVLTNVGLIAWELSLQGQISFLKGELNNKYGNLNQRVVDHQNRLAQMKSDIDEILRSPTLVQDRTRLALSSCVSMRNHFYPDETNHVQPCQTGQK